MRGALLRELANLGRGRRVWVPWVAGPVLLTVLLGRGARVSEPSLWGVFESFALACAVLAVTVVFLFAIDAVSRERDSQMMLVLRTSPMAGWRIVASKACVALVAYAGMAVATLAVAAVFSMIYGVVLLRAAAFYVLGPLLLCFLSLLGVALLVSVLSRSSRTAYLVGAVVTLPMLLSVGPATPGKEVLAGIGLATAGRFNPLDAAFTAGLAVVRLETTAWPALWGAAAVGALALVSAVAVFARQEERRL